jgi:hypothetical protein
VSATAAGIPEALCTTFLGWRLREDYDALLALGEGSLRLDLRSGEAWCDGEPLPRLFIAEALHGELEREIERCGVEAGALQEAMLEAEFETVPVWKRGEHERDRLRISCLCRLRIDTESFEHQARSG